MGTEKRSRRRFLQVWGASAAGCAFGLACSAKSGSPAQFGDVSAGNIKDLAEGDVRPVSSEPVFIARDQGGVYALTSTCTHQGCDVTVQGSGVSAVLICPCHRSQFDRNGAVQRGPANAPLVHFAVEIDPAGNITIHGGTQVGADTRVSA
jgi:cytochrome b6-f complex iron-sulfur subunit